MAHRKGIWLGRQIKDGSLRVPKNRYRDYLFQVSSERCTPLRLKEKDFFGSNVKLATVEELSYLLVYTCEVSEEDKQNENYSRFMVALGGIIYCDTSVSFYGIGFSLRDRPPKIKGTYAKSLDAVLNETEYVRGGVRFNYKENMRYVPKEATLDQYLLAIAKTSEAVENLKKFAKSRKLRMIVKGSEYAGEKYKSLLYFRVTDDKMIFFMKPDMRTNQEGYSAGVREVQSRGRHLMDF